MTDKTFRNLVRNAAGSGVRIRFTRPGRAVIDGEDEATCLMCVAERAAKAVNGVGSYTFVGRGSNERRVAIVERSIA